MRQYNFSITSLQFYLLGHDYQAGLCYKHLKRSYKCNSVKVKAVFQVFKNNNSLISINYITTHNTNTCTLLGSGLNYEARY